MNHLRKAVRTALEAELGDAYDCMRVWDAWHVGTMTEGDFTPVSDRIDEITTTVLAALTPPSTGDGAGGPLHER